MLKDIVEYVQQAVRLPEIIGERCVHALTEQASCQACVQSCPRQAWVLDDDSLGLLEEQCDGCGLCVPACPQQAIEHSSQRPVVRQLGDQKVLICACEKTELEAGEGVIPCVHALRLPQILKFYRQGCHRMMICRADCDDCPRGAAARLETRLRSLNGALHQRNQPLLGLQTITPEQWRSLYAQAPSRPSGKTLSRRQFFRRSTSQVADAGLQYIDAAEAPTPQTLGQLMPIGSEPSNIWPNLPAMDPGLCNGCDACVRLCPQQSLQLHEHHYRIEPALCSGCGVCVDVCDQAAIQLHYWQLGEPLEISLQHSKCRACGAPFHCPKVHGTANQNNALCRICTATRHYKALHQVYS